MKDPWPVMYSAFERSATHQVQPPTALEGCDGLLTARPAKHFRPGVLGGTGRELSWSESRLVRLAKFQTERRERAIMLDWIAPLQKRAGAWVRERGHGNY
jgi:hypothetical protein